MSTVEVLERTEASSVKQLRFQCDFFDSFSEFAQLCIQLDPDASISIERLGAGIQVCVFLDASCDATQLIEFVGHEVVEQDA